MTYLPTVFRQTRRSSEKSNPVRMRMPVIAENVFFQNAFSFVFLVNVNYRTISCYRAGIQVSAFCAPIWM